MKINSIFTYIIIIIFSLLIGRLIISIYNYYKSLKKSNAKYTLLQLISRLSPIEFEIWCSEYLINLGYSNIILSPAHNCSEKNIICKKNNNNYYVKCKKLLPGELLSLKEVKTFLGIMVGDNISNGIIITNGNVTEEAENFLRTLTATYNINIISASKFKIPYFEYIMQTN